MLLTSFIHVIAFNGFLSVSAPISITTTTHCPLPPCVNPCGPYETGSFRCVEGENVICQGYADCSGCYAKYYLNDVETTCTTEIDSKLTTTLATTPCFLPPCVNPCSPFENGIGMDGSSVHCKGYPNTQCQGYADCTGCYAKYFDGDTNTEIMNCELVYSEPEPMTSATTASISTTESDDCLIDCADPCGMSECPLYPDADCDFVVDCEKGCIAFYKDSDGNIVDCDVPKDTTTTDMYTTETGRTGVFNTQSVANGYGMSVVMCLEIFVIIYA